MAVSREELNRIAHGLASRAQLLAASRGGGLSGPREPEVAQELVEDCRQLRAEIRELQKEYQSLPGASESSSEHEVPMMSLLIQQRKLKAELAVLEREQANVLSTRSAVISSITQNRMIDSVSQLTLLLQQVRAEREAVRESLEREQQFLKEAQELEKTLEEELAQEEVSRGAPDPEADLRERIALAEESIHTLKQQLVKFTTEELCQPSDSVQGGKRKRGRGQTNLDSMLERNRLEGDGEEGGGEGATKFPSLADVIQELVSLALSSPHSPYLPLSSIWPPHSALLLRSEVIQHHPDNPTLIRITPFHL